MKPRVSAGLLMYRIRDGVLEIFLAHPGGPLYQKKDEGYWTIPKGEPPENEALHGCGDSRIRGRNRY